jgi:hypothetical protein
MVLVGILNSTGGSAFAAHPAKKMASTKKGADMIFIE